MVEQSLASHPKNLNKSLALHPKCLNRSISLASHRKGFNKSLALHPKSLNKSLALHRAQNVWTEVLLCTTKFWTQVFLCIQNVWTKVLVAPKMFVLIRNFWTKVLQCPPSKSVALHPKCLHKSLALHVSPRPLVSTHPGPASHNTQEHVHVHTCAQQKQLHDCGAWRVATHPMCRFLQLQLRKTIFRCRFLAIVVPQNDLAGS